MKTVRMIKYKNKKRKKVLEEAELIIVKFKTNMFSLFRFSCLHPYEHSKKLNYNQKGIVKSYKPLERRKSYSIYLDLIEEVNFQINVN